MAEYSWKKKAGLGLAIVIIGLIAFLSLRFDLERCKSLPDDRAPFICAIVR